MFKRLPYLMFLLCMAISFNGPQIVSAQSPLQKSQANQDKERKASAFSGPPIVGEFQAGPETGPDRVHRQLREERYTASHYHLRVQDPGRFVGGMQEHTALLFIDYVASGTPIDPRGIPASNSNAVVIGTVVGGKCFVTGDHTYVYTDYSVKIDQVLKQDALTNLIPGDVAVAAREGGAIHFPSGHVTNYLIAGRGLPEIGSQYVLFLWRPIPTFPEYEIIFESGYLLKDGRVYPLDDVNRQYVGVDAAVFLDEVRKIILASSQKGAGS